MLIIIRHLVRRPKNRFNLSKDFHFFFFNRKYKSDRFRWNSQLIPGDIPKLISLQNSYVLYTGRVYIFGRKWHVPAANFTWFVSLRDTQKPRITQAENVRVSHPNFQLNYDYRDIFEVMDAPGPPFFNCRFPLSHIWAPNLTDEWFLSLFRQRLNRMWK